MISNICRSCEWLAPCYIIVIGGVVALCMWYYEFSKRHTDGCKKEFIFKRQCSLVAAWCRSWHETMIHLPEWAAAIRRFTAHVTRWFDTILRSSMVWHHTSTVVLILLISLNTLSLIGMIPCGNLTWEYGRRNSDDRSAWRRTMEVWGRIGTCLIRLSLSYVCLCGLWWEMMIFYTGAPSGSWRVDWSEDQRSVGGVACSKLLTCTS